MADKTIKTKKKRVSKGQRIHTRRFKEAARKTDVASMVRKMN